MGLLGSVVPVTGCEKYEEDWLESCVRADQTAITGSIGEFINVRKFCSLHWLYSQSPFQSGNEPKLAAIMLSQLYWLIY